MQKRITGVFLLLALLAAANVLLPAPAGAGVEWQTRKTIKTDKAPVDIQVTADGKMTFVLTQGGKLNIYDSDAVLLDTIEVDPNTTLLSTDATGDRVFLGNPKEGTVKEILVEYIAKLSYEGSPYLGKANAPVVLAFFSDFQ